MTGKIRKSILYLFGITTSSLIVLFGIQPAGAAQSSWLRIYANYQETIEYFEGGTKSAGYLTGTSITPLADGHFLVAGFVKPVEGNNRRLAVLKINSGGAVSWYRELGPLSQAQAARVPPSKLNHQTWSEAAAFPDGGAAIAFGSYLVKLDPQGIPQWTRRFIRPYEVGDKKRAADLQLKAIVRREPEGFFLLGLEPDNPLHPEKSGNLILISTDSQGQNPQASLYQGLHESGRLKLMEAQGGLIVGAAPRAVARILPDRSLAWARSLAGLPFVRGPKRRPDRGQFLSYQSLAAYSVESGHRFRWNSAT